MGATVAQPTQQGRVILVIGAAHFISHFFQLAVPPLFPFIHASLGFSYTELGLLVTVFFIAGGFCQTPAGFLVDRVGARPVLIGGLLLLTAATALVATLSSYWLIALLLVIGGMGNSVFHPADFSILNGSISEGRLGRAFGIHSIGGNLGYAAAPVAMVALATTFGWRQALLAVGLTGVAAALFVASQGAALRDGREAHRSSRKAAGADAGDGASLRSSLQLLAHPAVTMCFAFFILFSMAQIGVQTFTIPVAGHTMGLSEAAASVALTGFLVAMPAGTLFGGYLVDRTPRHAEVAGIALIGSAVLIAAAGVLAPGAFGLAGLFIAAGALYGMIYPSRDMLVRGVAPQGSRGKVYGFVYSGLDIGAAITPAIFGWLVDRGQARAILPLVGAIILASFAVFIANRRTLRSTA